MISQDKRKAIYLLHEQGMGIRAIAKNLNINRGTIREIIKQKGQLPDVVRKDKIEIDAELLKKLHKDCNGYVQRIHEKLLEEEDIKVGYSTLTRMIRELGLGKPANKRCGKVTDIPGDEMQHDTSPYILTIGSKKIPVQASLLYYRYSKVRYLKFYRSFTRFKMKCFFHEALTFWGYAAATCIIDNTNLARLHGTGRHAVIVPEMERFADQYGFKFVCHEKGHANRKAGDERGFFTTVTNFFPGRRFDSFTDLNQQAFLWATQRMANRAVGKTRLIPVNAFELEKPYLNQLPAYVEPPYLIHTRRTDQYGFASFEGNFYWVPGTGRFDVKLLQYANRLKVYHHRKLLAEYELPEEGVKNKEINPIGQKKASHRPKFKKYPTADEERILRNVQTQVDLYLTFALAQKSGKPRHRFIRHLYSLYQKTAPSLFAKTIKRALKYRITDIKTIERIAVLLMKEDNFQVPVADIDHEFKQRESYIQGRFTAKADLSFYDKLIEDSDEG